MIPIALSEKFNSLNFITCIVVNHMTRHSGKANNVNTVRGRTGNGPIQNRKIYYVKIKVIAFILNFG